MNKEKQDCLGVNPIYLQKNPSGDPFIFTENIVVLEHFLSQPKNTARNVIFCKAINKNLQLRVSNGFWMSNLMAHLGEPT